MTEVATVRGPVDSTELGSTLMHEHIFVLTPEIQQNYPGEWDEETMVAEAVRRLTAVKEAGVSTIVDPTVVGLGRYLPRIQRINEQVDLNIVVATGVYTYGDAPFYFRFRGPAVAETLPEPMVEMFVRDIEEGIAGTGVRAAFLKCAVDAPGLTTDGERIMRAVAAAHRRTGVPITVHTHPGTKRGLDVQRILDDEGVDPRRVVLAHSGDSTDADHLSELAEAGFYLGMDRFGIELEVPFADRVGIVVELCRRGYADRLVLSHDASCYIDWVDPGLMAALPNWHYLHIHRDVLPALRAARVTTEQIRQMLVDNPRRYFETRDAS
ncbi:MAG TPA: phosphotriesterase-related protein [Mycobacteriales bacterium]|nr:phosphotriesterase-related protein [Mycobacteriales bacterium]